MAFVQQQAFEVGAGVMQPMQTAPVSYGAYAMPTQNVIEPFIETIPSVSFPQYAMPTQQYAMPTTGFIQASPPQTMAYAPAVEYAQPAFTTVPAVQTFAQAPAVEYVQAAPAVEYIQQAPVFEYAAAAPAVEYVQAPVTYAQAPVPTYAQAPVTYAAQPAFVEAAPAVTYAAAPQFMEAPQVTYAAQAPAVYETFAAPQQFQFESTAAAPMVETIAAPTVMPTMGTVMPTMGTMSYAPMMAQPSYTPMPTAGSYYLPQSSSMIAYPGFQGASGPFNFTAGPIATVSEVQQPMVLPGVAAPEVQKTEPAVVAPAAPKKKKVSKKTKKGCC